MGREPEVIGAASVLPVGKVSGAVKGQQGVFVIKVESRTDAPVRDSYASNARALKSSLASRVDYEVFEALKKRADIKDNRSRFY
jgi:peptidylprolyl isomerase/peptidyl-prolyl cis-trans isomerase D